MRQKLSVVVVSHAMATQIKNTLQSLLPPQLLFAASGTLLLLRAVLQVG